MRILSLTSARRCRRTGMKWFRPCSWINGSALRRAAEVRAWDPVISATEVDLAARVLSSRDSVLDGADGLLILSDWDEFSACDLGSIRTSMRHPVVIDCVGALELRRADLTGIRYVSMGRAAQGDQ